MKSEIEVAVDYLVRSLRENLQIDADSLRSVNEMVDAILTSKRIFLYGVGRSGLVAKAFAIRLVQLGLDCFFVGECNTPMVVPESAVIIISNTGQTMSAVQTANITRRIGARVIAISSDINSKLAHAASSNIIIASRVVDDDGRRLYAPLGTTFEEACALLMDAIVSALMKRLSETDDSMRRRHAIWV